MLGSSCIDSREICVLLDTAMPYLATKRIAESVGLERALHTANAIVCRLDSVDGNADAAESGLRRRGDALLVQVAPAAGHRASHVVFSNSANDVEPVVAEIGFAANQRDLTRAEPCELLLDDVDALGCRQLFLSCRARTRATMAALQVAGEGDFPNGVCRPVGENVIDGESAANRHAEAFQITI